MRIVVIDTETTGLNPKRGDRMVEIGAIVIEDNEIQMDQTFHRFIDPQRDIPPEVVNIHGIDAHKLATESALPFAKIGQEFLEFIADSTLLFHNAPFDLGFIKNELADAGLPSIDDMPIIDSLVMARKRFPKQANNLDALCDRFSIDRSHRQLHGALLDATLTAQVFLKLINKETITEPSRVHQGSSLPDHRMQDLMISITTWNTATAMQPNGN